MRLMQPVKRSWRIFSTGLCFVLFGIGALLFGGVGGAILAPLPLSRERKQRTVRAALSRACFVYVRIMRALGLCTFCFEGTEQLHRRGVLIVANHPTLLDVIFLISVLPDITCIVKAELFKNPLTRWIVNLAGYLPNDRSGEVLVRNAAEALRRGETLLIFPEGTRTRDVNQLQLKRGAANIALQAQCDVIPVLIRCDPLTLRKGQSWYDVPDRRSHYNFKVLPSLAPASVIDLAKPSAVQARQLTAELAAIFSRPAVFAAA